MITPSSNNILGSNIGFQSNFLTQKSNALNFNQNKNNTAYYAKKGEPMYMKEMDADEDGIVSLDEFKDYCQENGVSTKEMVKMVEMANSYRTMKANEKASKAAEKGNHSEQNKIEEAEHDAIYAKRGDGKYDEAMDTNNDDKVTYKEYIEYCREHAKQQDKKSSAKVEESENGEFKTSNKGRAIQFYAKSEPAPEGKFDDLG